MLPPVMRLRNPCLNFGNAAGTAIKLSGTTGKFWPSTTSGNIAPIAAVQTGPFSRAAIQSEAPTFRT
jgi:hypothetical protein